MRNTRRLCSFIFLACGSLIAMSSMANADEAVAIPIASASALEYHNASNWFWGLNQGVGLALPLLLLVTGWGARQYKFLVRVFRERRVLPLASFAALYFLLDRSLRLPIAYAWDRAYGEASGTQGRALVPWLGGHVIEWVLPVGGLVLVVLFHRGACLLAGGAFHAVLQTPWQFAARAAHCRIGRPNWCSAKRNCRRTLRPSLVLSAGKGHWHGADSSDAPQRRATPSKPRLMDAANRRARGQTLRQR